MSTRQTVEVPPWQSVFEHVTLVNNAALFEVGTTMTIAPCTTRMPARRCDCGRYALIWQPMEKPGSNLLGKALWRVPCQPLVSGA